MRPPRHLALARAVPYSPPMLPALPLEVLASLRTVTWLALLDTYGAPDSLPRADASTLSPLDLATRVAADPFASPSSSLARPRPHRDLLHRGRAPRHLQRS